MFIDGVDAFAHTIAEICKKEDLVFANEYNNNRIVNLNIRMSRFQNGIKYCSVQVECKNGEVYHVQVDGHEADQLYQLAANYKQRVEQEEIGLQEIEEILRS